MEQLKKERPLWVAIVSILLGIFELYFGGDWIVEGAMFVVYLLWVLGAGF